MYRPATAAAAATAMYMLEDTGFILYEMMMSTYL